MDQEQSWIQIESVGADTHTAHEVYQYFMSKEPREELGPIRIIDDPYLGRTKVRDVRVGMTRNANEDNKKVVTAYLQPYPHTRIDTAKPLQGWYKSLHEPQGVRARPCFTEAILTEPFGGWCAVGCGFCLTAGQQVATPDGTVNIESLQVGDVIWGRTTVGATAAEVVATTRRQVQLTVELVLSNGVTIRCTPDHPIWSESQQRWKNAEDFSSGEALQALRTTSKDSILLQGMLVSSQPETQETTKALQMRSRDTAIPLGVRSVLIKNQKSQRNTERRQAFRSQGSTQVSVNSTAHARSRASKPREHVPESARTEVSGIQGSQGGGCSLRNIRVQAVEARCLRVPQGTAFQYEIGVGALDCSVAGLSTAELGIRAICDPNSQRSIPTGLSTGEWETGRGQGLPNGLCQAEVGGGSEYGLRDRTVRPEALGRVRNPTVKAVRRIQETVWVYDIQTTTENFYAQGVLVHNCYVNSGFRGYRGTGLITVPLNYGTQLRQQLTKIRRAAAGYFSSFTDPFLPLEQYYHNTQQGAEAFVELGLPIFFLSRLRYPDWAVELLTKNPHSYAQKSINTSNPQDWHYLSPGALDYADHLKDIRRLKNAGIYVSIQCNPIIPGITSHGQVQKLFRDLKAAGADHVIVKFVEAGYSWAPTMVERMIKRFGERGERFAALFTENIGGQRTIEESYRMNAHDLYSRWAKQLGLTYATCYEYEYRRDANGNVLDKTGVSVGRKYTTADQCHGHAVPVYTRNSAEEQFQPVAECPPSGCLYCASENNDQPRCGDELAGQANALRLVDMKAPLGKGKPKLLSLPMVGE